MKNLHIGTFSNSEIEVIEEAYTRVVFDRVKSDLENIDYVFADVEEAFSECQPYESIDDAVEKVARYVRENCEVLEEFDAGLPAGYFGVGD
jgi:hypothetical protein